MSDEGPLIFIITVLALLMFALIGADSIAKEVQSTITEECLR